MKSTTHLDRTPQLLAVTPETQWMKANSTIFQQFTFGIEEEFQIVDPHTRELRSHVSEILAEGKTLLASKSNGNDSVDDPIGRRSIWRRKKRRLSAR